MTTVDVEHFGVARSFEIIAESRVLARYGIASRGAGEWKDVGRIEESRIRLCVTRWLGEAMVEAPATGTGGVGEESVERDAAPLVGVETLIEKVPDEPSRLRDTVA